MLGGVAEGSWEDREKRYGPTQNAAMRCRPETPKTKRCAVARKETMRCRFAFTHRACAALRGRSALRSHWAEGRDAPRDRGRPFASPFSGRRGRPAGSPAALVDDLADVGRLEGAVNPADRLVGLLERVLEPVDHLLLDHPLLVEGLIRQGPAELRPDRFQLLLGVPQGLLHRLDLRVQLPKKLLRLGRAVLRVLLPALPESEARAARS